MKKIATLLLAAGLLFSAAGMAQAIDFKIRGQWIMAFDYGEHGAFTGGNGNKAIVTAGVHSSVDELAGLRGSLLGRSLLFKALALLLAGEELLVHILDLEVGQVAVLDGLAQDLAGVGSVNVQVDDVVILNAHHAVAVGLCKGTHLGGAGTLVLVDEELGAVAVGNVLHLHQVIGEHALTGILGGQLGLVGSSFAAGNNGLAVEHLAHALKDDHNALTACVHNAGLLQHGQQVGGVLQCLLTGSQHYVPQGGHIGGITGSGFLGSNACHGQDSALGGLHHGLVGTLNALLQGSHDIGSVSLFFALQSLGEAAEQQAGDNAGVAARTAQHGRSSSLGSFAHGAAVVQSFQLTHGSAHGHAHVGAGVAIRHGENVQLVHAGTLVVDVVGAGNDGVAQDLTRNHCSYSLVTGRKIPARVCRQIRR